MGWPGAGPGGPASDPAPVTFPILAVQKWLRTFDVIYFVNQVIHPCWPRRVPHEVLAGYVDRRAGGLAAGVRDAGDAVSGQRDVHVRRERPVPGVDDGHPAQGGRRNGHRCRPLPRRAGRVRVAGLLGRVDQGAVALRAALAVLAPLAAILVWALYLSPRSPRRVRDPAALVSELAIFGTAGAALGVTWTAGLAAAFAVVAAVDAVLMRVFQQHDSTPASERPAAPWRRSGAATHPADQQVTGNAMVGQDGTVALKLDGVTDLSVDRLDRGG